MAESATHKRLKIVACAYLKKMCRDLIAMETKFRNLHSKADACGINLTKKEIRVIEVKASYKDYLRDKKLFQLDTSYYPHCNYFYIMCPTDVIPKDKVLKEFGLLYVDEKNNVTVIQKPIKNNTNLKTRFATTVKNTSRAITNMLLYKLLNITDEVTFLKKKYKKR